MSWWITSDNGKAAVTAISALVAVWSAIVATRSRADATRSRADAARSVFIAERESLLSLMRENDVRLDSFDLKSELAHADLLAALERFPDLRSPDSEDLLAALGRIHPTLQKLRSERPSPHSSAGASNWEPSDDTKALLLLRRRTEEELSVRLKSEGFAEIFERAKVLIVTAR